MAGTRHKIIAIRSGSHNGMDWEAEYEITFEYRPGSPDHWNKAGGHWEQGWADEVEFVSISPGAGDHGAFSDIVQRSLEDWAADWLDGDGYAAAIAVVAGEKDIASAREEGR